MINNARRQHRGNRCPGRMARDSSALGTLSLSPTLGVPPILRLCLSLPPTLPLSLPHPVSAELSRSSSRPQVDIDRHDLLRANPISRRRVVRNRIHYGSRTTHVNGQAYRRQPKPDVCYWIREPRAGRRVFCDGWLFAGIETVKNTRRVYSKRRPKKSRKKN